VSYSFNPQHGLLVVQKADLERDKKFVAEQKLTEGADEVFVNGDSFIPNARALEPVFKARMFAPVEA
jgi:adenine-specific DNA-methyltransferase